MGQHGETLVLFYSPCDWRICFHRPKLQPSNLLFITRSCLRRRQGNWLSVGRDVIRSQWAFLWGSRRSYSKMKHTYMIHKGSISWSSNILCICSRNIYRCQTRIFIFTLCQHFLSKITGYPRKRHGKVWNDWLEEKIWHNICSFLWQPVWQTTQWSWKPVNDPVVWRPFSIRIIGGGLSLFFYLNWNINAWIRTSKLLCQCFALTLCLVLWLLAVRQNPFKRDMMI